MKKIILLFVFFQFLSFLCLGQVETNKILDLEIYLNNTIFNDTIFINGTITNLFNITINGTLSIKFKQINMGNYPDNWIIIYQNVSIPTGIVSLSDITDNFTWTIPEDIVSGEYKGYVRFDLDKISKNKTNRTYISDSVYFNISGIGNIFIDFWNASNFNLSVNDTLNISINITNNELKPCNIGVFLIIEKFKTISEGEQTKSINCNNIEIKNNTTQKIRCNWTIPSDALTTKNLKIYPKINFTYHNLTIEKRGKEKKINIYGLEDLGKPNLTIISFTPELKFGDFGTTFIKFYSGNYNYSLLSFVTYAYKPKWATKTLSGNTLRSKPCEQDVAVKLKNIKRNQTIYVAIPFFVNQNCDNDCPNGDYIFNIKVCSNLNNSWNEVIRDAKYNITIKGKNPSLCPKTKIIYKTKETSKKKSEVLEMKILNLTTTVIKNHEFTTTIKLKNKANKRISFEIYSYVYKGKKCITGSWTSNKEKISLNKGEEKIVNLTNKIKKDAESGEYTYKVRAVIGYNKIDLTDKIKVIEGLVEDKTIIKENPKLKIWNDTKLRINLSDCQGCKMIIIGPNVSTITNKKYRVFEDFGKYEIFVIKDEVILNKSYFWKEKNVIKNLTKNNLTECSKITGKFYEVKPTENFFSKITNLFFSLIKLMEKSIHNK